MKLRFTVPALLAVAALGTTALVAHRANANQTVSRSYSYPNGNSTYLSATATCRTGWPDFDSDCFNGNSIGMKWLVRTTSRAQVDLEYKSGNSINISPGGHFWCNETLYCSDGSTPSFTYLDVPCGWAQCPVGRSASSIQLSFGIDNNPS